MGREEELARGLIKVSQNAKTWREMSQLTKRKPTQKYTGTPCKPKRLKTQKGKLKAQLVCMNWWTVFVNWAYWRCSTSATLTVLIISILNLQTIAIALDVVKWRGSRIGRKGDESHSVCITAFQLLSRSISTDSMSCWNAFGRYEKIVFCIS